MANKKGAIAALAAGAGVLAASAVTAAALRKTRRLQDEARAKGAHVPYGPYEAVVKRPLDVVLAVAALIALSPVMAVTAVAVRVKLGNPVFFKQVRPGLADSATGEETLFEIYKFRSMTDECDPATGDLLPDEERLTPFGRWLRGSSFDELPELVNILKGDMAVIGPRPQLVRDMVFMTPEQRRRHQVRPGLSGLAQVNGRNALEWSAKLAADLDYIDRISFAEDARIVAETLHKVILRAGTAADEADVADDYGDYLLAVGAIDEQEYERLQEDALGILREDDARCMDGRVCRSSGKTMQ